jgi:hypothetical protein
MKYHTCNMSLWGSKVEYVHGVGYGFNSTFGTKKIVHSNLLVLILLVCRKQSRNIGFAEYNSFLSLSAPTRCTIDRRRSLYLLEHIKSCTGTNDNALKKPHQFCDPFQTHTVENE